jgi:hypothetical protein
MPSENLKFLLEQSPETYWIRPRPQPHDGDDDANKIYAAVGFALSCWESLETSLADLFIMLAEPYSISAIKILRCTYGAIGFNPGRRQAVEFAGELYFGKYWKTTKRSFNRILSHIDRASQRRDDIAHGHVVGFLSSQNGLKPDTMDGFFLVPPRYNARLNFVSPETMRETDPQATYRGRYKFTADFITNTANKFKIIEDSLYEYMEQISKDNGEFRYDFLEQYANQPKSAPRPR